MLAALMKTYPNVLGSLGLYLLSATCYAQTVEIAAAHYPVQAQHHQMQLDVSTSPKHRVFVLENPSRLVIDIKNAALKQSLAQPAATHPLFAKVRAGVKSDTDLRIVVDLKKPVNAKHFSLSSNNRIAHQLTIDLRNTSPNAGVEANASKQPPTITDKKNLQTSVANKLPPLSANQVSTQTVANKKTQPIIVAIDAGHGGTDPGAQGPQGTEEKSITFSIAKKLEQLINSAAGMKAVMVRKGDYLIDLRERTKIARAADADLFISIHADAYHDPTVSGASVYTLSRSGASSEAARWLANSENAADAKLGGVKLDDKEEDIASVLVDLSQSASQQASVDVASQLLKSFHEVCGLHRTEVQNAGFIVLKSPDMPSILVETAFISNPDEEKNLLSNRYQSKMAHAMFSGIRNYFKQNKTVDSKVAALKF
jgi:N-acetylmuramoyl-L-alanine amidase